MTDVNVTLGDGRQGVVDEADVPAVLAAGGTADVAGAQAAQREEAFGGLTGALTAGAAGLARMGTLGASDYAIPKLAALVGNRSADEYRQILGDVNEQNPYARMTGEFAGLVTPGAAVKGAQAAGQFAARTVAEKIGAKAVGALGRIAASGVELGTAGAVEGAIFGAGSAVSEAALGDTELTAEKLLMGAGEGGAIGFGVGAILGGAGRALSEAGSGISARIGRRAAPSLSAEAAVASEAAVATKELGQEAAERAVGDAVDGATVAADKAAVGALATDTKSLAKRAFENERRLVDSDDVIDGLAKRTFREVSEPMRQADDAVRDAWGLHKMDTMAKYADEALIDSQLLATSEIATKVQSTIDFYAERANQMGVGSQIKKMNEWIAEYSKLAVEKGGRGASGELYTLTDKLKRTMAEPAGFGRNIAGSPDQQEAIRQFDAIYHDIRANLERADVWGERVAGAQQAVNKGYTASLQSARQFRDAFTTVRGTELGRPVEVLDPGKLKSFFRDPTGAETLLKNEYVNEYVAGRRELFDALEAHGDLTPATKAKIAAGRSAIDKLEASVAAATKEATEVSALQKQKALESGGAIGGLVGLVTDFFTRPITTAERLGALARTVDRTSARISKAVDSIAENVGKGRPSPRMAKDEAIAAANEVNELAANPSLMLQRVKSSIGAVSDAAPQVATAMASAASRGLAHLATLAPKDLAATDPLKPNEHVARYDPVKLQQFSTALQTMRDPIGTIERAAKDGTLSVDHVDALEVYSPKLFQQIRMDVMAAVQKSPRKYTYADRVLLGILFKAPTDATLDPSFVAAMRKTKAAPPPEPQAGQAKPNYGRSAPPTDVKPMMTESERIASR